LLGHFAFGLFSSNSHNAQISLSDISVLNPGGTAQYASVTVTVTDTGNDPVNITSVTVGGQPLYLFSPTTKNYITLQPGQSYTFTSTNNIYTNPGGGNPTLNVGSTIVVQVTATDIVTKQTLATQATTVVQD